MTGGWFVFDLFLPEFDGVEPTTSAAAITKQFSGLFYRRLTSKQV